MSQHALKSVSQAFVLSWHLLSMAVIKIMTLPYYRLYYFNTTAPLERIATMASESPFETPKVLRAISSWRLRKLTELQFITIASTVLAAAVVGSFSWTTIEEAYWLTHGFWHVSLIFSTLDILLSASEVTALHLLGPVRLTGNELLDTHTIKKYYPLLLSPNDRTGKYSPRLKMIFTWQAPVMFMSYSVCSFLVGLTLLVCTPLIRDRGSWTTGHSVAVMYLSFFAGAGVVFIFCSFWVYHYVHLDLDSDGTDYDIMELHNRVGTGATLTPFTVEVSGQGPSSAKLDRRYTSLS